MAALIEVQNLKKYFETPRGTLHAVDDVSFKIEQATTMGVVGESGCGYFDYQAKKVWKNTDYGYGRKVLFYPTCGERGFV